MTQTKTISGYIGTITHDLLPADLRARMSWQTSRDFDLRDEELVYIAKGLGAVRTQLSVHVPQADQLEHYSMAAFAADGTLVLDVPYGWGSR